MNFSNGVNMAAVNIHIQLQPRFSGQTATHLSVLLAIGGLTGGLLCQWNKPPNDYGFVLFSEGCVDADEAIEKGGICNIVARDSRGSPVTLSIEKGACISSIPDAELRVTYDVHPSQGQAKRESRSLVRDHGGLAGVGSAILPPILTAIAEATLASVTLHWNFDEGPRDTKGVTSLQIEDGQEGMIVSAADSKSLNDAIFFIGQVVSHASPTGRCSTHYLRELPPCLAELVSFSADIFPKMSEHFLDRGGVYHLFIRNIPHQRLRGATIGNSGMVDYEDASAQETHYELTRLLTRCMIARWAHLDDDETREERDWYQYAFQGLYSIYFPFRFKLRPPAYFRETLNGYLTSYFSNPLVETPQHALPDEAEVWHVQALRASRATMYMIRMDSHLRRSLKAKSTETERPIDEIIREMSLSARRGERARLQDWIQLVGDWIGHENAVETTLADMKSGKYMGFEDIQTAFGGSMVLEEQHVLEMGFARKSLETGLVEGLVSGSNAQKAGLRDGDEIVWYQRPELVEQNHDARYRLVVKREGSKKETTEGEQQQQQQHTIEWWPRGRIKVRAWQSREKK